MSAMLAKTMAVIFAAAGPVPVWAAAPAIGLAAPGATDVPCNPSALASAIAGASDGDVLSLAPRCSYQLTAALPVISSNLTILGNYATIRRSRASGTQEFTMLANEGGLAISDLSFRGPGPHGPGAGSAIENDGDLTVTGGLFTGNTTTGFGGAIENTGTLTVSGAIFRDNHAYDGAAIENLASATITASFFHNNRSDFNGGAIHNEGELRVTDSYFNGNSAAVNGGALFNGVFGDVATVTGTFLHRNQASSGGGIYNEDIVDLTGTRLSGNQASGQGGGIFTDWVLEVTASRIDHNIAADGGGGIYNGDFFGPPGSVDLSDATVRHNQPDNCEPAGTIASCTNSDPAAHRLRPVAIHPSAPGSGYPQRKVGTAQALAPDFYPGATADQGKEAPSGSAGPSSPR